MKLTSRPGRRLAAGIALTCSAILVPATGLALPATAGTPAHHAHHAAAARPPASSITGAAARPQQRQIAVTTLSYFKVVLTVTREPKLAATVTGSGYRHTARGWKLIATKRIGKAAAWSWYATDVCSLKVTQLKPEPSTAAPSDSITVSLLWGPAIGCLGPYTKHWRP